ncbi:hypothetical protein FGADI_1137 [Fusarium gaditjirri]|uniref:Heterokaryon incompatibility domain-containing protein n=1 Tax=Fusarium gaditjirri TaxID=282569 RepID=A0A8H4TLS8_9HYPO|nr:hypothetical protein FGADI_1137 [Fusarium gaditjirri]
MAPSLVTIDASEPLEKIFEVIDRDGGVIVSNFLSPELLKESMAAIEPHFSGRKLYTSTSTHDELGEDFFPEGSQRVYKSGYVLASTAALRLVPGAKPQPLHRDQIAYQTRPDPSNPLFTPIFGCLIAGSKCTYKNGATAVIPGSHLWGADRIPKLEECTYAEMEPGSALFTLGSTYHAVGENKCDISDPDALRTLFACFAQRDYYRLDQDEVLSTPIEIAQTLPDDILRLAGYYKAVSGVGYVEDHQNPVEFMQKEENGIGKFGPVALRVHHNGRPALKNKVKNVKYNQLEDPDRWIRLVKLEPSPSEPTSEPDRPDLLVCTIEEYIRGHSAPYTALSYVWESPDSPKKHVRIDGTAVDISSTVENALRRLRFRKKPRWLWVDQLCINQANEVEKSHQVHQMHHIYREADQVIAWLGNGDESSDLICRLMRDTGRALRSNDLEGLQKLYSGNKEEGSIDLEAAKEAFHAYCQRRYWQRLWIMQEFAVGRRIAIACGDWIVKYDLMDQTLDAPSIVRRRAQKKPVNGLESLIRNLNYVYSTPLNSYVYSLFTRRWHYVYTPDGEHPWGQPLLQVVAVSLTLEVDYNVVHATDPRDRIFALLNLTGDRDHFDLFPDYSMTVEEVYRETACKILEQGTIDVLMYCQRPRKLASLPSWVPDWSMDVLHPNAQPPWNNPPFKASGKYTAIPQFPHFDTAIFDGIYVDKVQEIGATWDPNWLKPINPTAVRQWLKSIRGFCDSSPRVRVGEERLDAARIGILDGTTYFSTVPYQGWGSQCAEDSEKIQQPNTAEGEEAGEASSTEGSFYASALMRMHTRRAFMTSTGFVGVGPLDIQPGDEVCILLGGKIPYLLRAQGDEAYTLVGEAYVHGVMHGELFKGGARNLRSFTVK